MDIKNKVIIITGASSGIGLVTAKLFFEKGAKLALVSNEKEKLEDISKELTGSLAVLCDMTNNDEIKEMVKKVRESFGRIDILINNAGQGYQAPVEKVSTKVFQHIFNLNVLGPLIAMQEVIPLMRQQNGGAIVNISSGTALMYIPNMSVYSSSKRALVGISLTAREELKNDHITVGVVYPYITVTDFYKNLITESGDKKSANTLNINSLHPADSAEFIAQKILEATQTGAAETFAHDWMKKMAANE